MSATRRRVVGLTLLGLLLAACGPPRVAVEPAAQDDPAERVVIDTRIPAEFAAGHAPGALNIQSGYGQLKSRMAAYVPDRATPLALRASNQAEAEAAAAVLLELGYSDVALFTADDESATLAVMDTRALRAELASDAPPLVIDVRSPGEWARGTIPGALLVDHDAAPGVLPELDRARRIAVICEGGWRSSQLASLLAREGFPDVVNVIDGMAGWRALDD